MPTLALMYDNLIRKPNQEVLDYVRLQGLTKLIAQGFSGGLLFVSPDNVKSSQEEREEEMERWRRTHNGPYPIHLRTSTVWMPQKLVRGDGKSPKINQAYTPIRFELPTSNEETYGQLKERIEEESMRAVEYVRKDVGGKVKAFYIGNLHQDYVISDATKQCMLIAGDSFLDRSARDELIPRVIFDLCLFDLEEE